MNDVIPQELLEHKIFIVRSHKVMLSPDLARLYQVEVKVLVQSVKRNLNRFPEDFMFQLSDAEFKNLKSQIVTSSWGGDALQCSQKQTGRPRQYPNHARFCPAKRNGCYQ
ncbi:MAG: ORF6N domain-containing protein [Candidatus Omnitrophota bacterium]